MSKHDTCVGCVYHLDYVNRCDNGATCMQYELYTQDHAAIVVELLDYIDRNCIITKAGGNRIDELRREYGEKE